MRVLSLVKCFVLIILSSPWLLLNGLLAIIGTIIRRDHLCLDSTTVRESWTICRVLHSKQLLNSDEYEFEAGQVAAMYSKATFTGYMFIMAPVIFLLRHTTWLDSTMLPLVHRWMVVHQDKIGNLRRASWFERKAVRASTTVAHHAGTTLHFIETKIYRKGA